ncbi:zinc finger protein 692-like isoform X2 [Hyperolius riggenbachi]|uniref:zinc finger protein 692-like isoform X2 n=1 Tax=Hyperolius riggenbachi TaxID=752182 RepID=UPI0035A3923E
MQTTVRREKRRLLDAQRGKCRIRLGSHLDEWCALKDHLGFAQHAQLAKFLLDSYMSTTNPESTVQSRAVALLSVSLISLKHLAYMCHQHGRDCPTPPSILSSPPSGENLEMPILTWGCKEHHFYWNPRDCVTEKDASFTDGNVEPKTPDNLFGHSDRTTQQEQNVEVVSNLDSQPGEAENQEERLLRLNACLHGGNIELSSTESLPESGTCFSRSPENNAEHIEHSAGQVQLSERLQVLQVNAAEQTLKTTTYDEEPKNTESKQEQTPLVGRTSRRHRVIAHLSDSCHKATTAEPKTTLSVPRRGSSRGSKRCQAKAGTGTELRNSSIQDKESNESTDPDVVALPETEISVEICPIEESLVEEDIGPSVSADDLECLPAEENEDIENPEENLSVELIWQPEDVNQPEKMPPGEPQPAEGTDEQDGHSEKATRLRTDVDDGQDQICKKRIRKAAPYELLMCEYNDCGKIFSKRQYLNYHQKYQHMNQRAFRCSVADCGKTFNFKKHLKEHEKRHSDRRDFICEFCARAFRSNSNLIIHRRIHTGEKPLQCEFCGFTCRQKASLNWHMKKHDAAAFYQFPCDICGQRFEKKDNLAAHKSRKHPEPRSTAALTTDGGEGYSAENTSPHELADKAEASETVTEMSVSSQDSIKVTVFPEYLELAESIQEAPTTTQAAGSTAVSMIRCRKMHVTLTSVNPAWKV